MSFKAPCLANDYVIDSRFDLPSTNTWLHVTVCLSNLCGMKKRVLDFKSQFLFELVLNIFEGMLPTNKVIMFLRAALQSG